MSPDERTRIELAQRLAELFGDDLAAYLMETVPPFSWHEVVTKSDLRDRTDLIRAEARELQQETIAVFRGELVQSTRQMTYGTVAAMGVVAASIIAAVKL
ncbi:MAG TPA: hypothetical protein VFC99_11250 [Acidimicrobiia bacterium]|nr:hypothetical protein [Acidimicrobiia bacterium]